MRTAPWPTPTRNTNTPQQNLATAPDTEKEEMLTVSRKEVMKHFREAKLDSIYYPCDSKDYAQAIGRKIMLVRLFGKDKCLPDKDDSSESDSLAHLEPKAKSDYTPIPEKTFVSNWDKTEQKPVEPKFKVGDIVRFKYCCTPYRIDGFKISDGVMLYQVGEVWADESDLEPYTEPDTSHETPVCENHSDDTSQKEVKVVMRMKPIKAKVRVYLATKEEDEEFRLLLHENGFKWNSGDSLIDSSMWESDIESAKIHFFYPDKTVTYDGNKTPDTLTFSEFKKQYFGGNANHRQNIANCDILLDNILKNSFRNERRLNIAAMAMQGILANPDEVHRAGICSTAKETPKAIAEYALALADALLAKCEKGGSK